MKILYQYLLILLFISLLTSTSEAKLHVQRQVLPNGMIVLTAQKHNLPVVMVSMGIKAGLTVEPPLNPGLANLTAELLTEGTHKRSSLEISEELDFMGASLNASAGRDIVTVNLSVLKKDIDKGFDILADCLKNPLFYEEEVEKQKKRIKGSIKSSEEDPAYIAAVALRKAIFGQEHPYGKPIMGTMESVENLIREQVVDFHHVYYRPERTIMAIVGDTYPEERDRLITKYFDDWQGAATIPVPPSFTDPDMPKKVDIITIDRKLTQATVVMGHPGIKRNNPDYYAITIMNYILGSGGFTSRLMDNIREDKGLVYGVFSYFSSPKEKGLFAVSLQTKNESANKAISEVIHEINRMKSEGVTEQELNDARSYLTGSFPLKLETNSKIANFLVAVEFYGLGMDYMYTYPDIITSVTHGDVDRAAQKYLKPESLTIVVVADQKKAEIKKF
jgi:zinc protease